VLGGALQYAYMLDAESNISSYANINVLFGYFGVVGFCTITARLR
jgi:hypothetical protein